MKNPLLPFLPLFALVFLTGCASSDRVLYQSVDGLSRTVDTALEIYGAEVAAGNVSPETQARVAEAKREYEVTMNAAIDYLLQVTADLPDEFVADQPAPPRLVAAAAALLTILNQIDPEQ